MAGWYEISENDNGKVSFCAESRQRRSDFAQPDVR